MTWFARVLKIEIAAKRRLVFAGCLLSLLAIVTILFAIQNYTHDSVRGISGPIDQYFRWALEEWYPWALFSPIILWLATAHSIDPRRLLSSFSLHLAASAFLAVLADCLQALGAHFLEKDRTVLVYIGFFLSKNIVMNIATYWAVMGCAQAIVFYRESNHRRLRESKLEKQLAEAQLQVLQMQLHPHFLFNTLHAIGTLMREDTDSAEQMLLDLSTLLRTLLEQNPSSQISLRRELALVNRYLNIQKVRFGGRLHVRSGIEPDALDCAVPSLILQPLVENAIIHGIARNPGSDLIEIKASKYHAQLQIEVSNSSSTLPKNIGPDGAGWRVGLSNTAQRLKQMYGEEASLALHSGAGQGVICRILLPFRIYNSESSDAFSVA